MDEGGPLTPSPVKLGTCVLLRGKLFLSCKTPADRVHVWVVPRPPPRHNQKLLPSLASLILLPAPREGGTSEQSCTEQNKQSDASGGGWEEGKRIGWGEVNTAVWLMMFWKCCRRCRRCCHDFQLTLNARLYAQINCELLL